MTTSRSFYAQRAPIFPSSPSVMEPVDVELQSARCLFGEKVKELSVAVAKVDALTRQLEELRSGNTSNSYHVVSGINGSSLKVSQEYEKLRKELLYRNKLIDDQNSELSFKKTLLSQKKSELLQIDDRIHELQERLAKKKHLNQQQMQAQAAMHQNKSPSACHPPLSYSSLRSSVGPGLPGFGPKKLLSLHNPAVLRQSGSGCNVAAVEPMQRLHHSFADQTENHVNNMHDALLNGKQSQADTKFQTLPHNTKFGKTSLISCTKSDRSENRSDSTSPSKPGTQDHLSSDVCISNGGRANGRSLHTDATHDTNGLQNDKKVADDVDRQVVDQRSHNSDWQKDRRRPVIADDDMELALSAPMPCTETEAKSWGKMCSRDREIGCPDKKLQSVASALSDRRQDVSQRLTPIVSSDGLLLKNRSDRRDENGNESADGTLISKTNCMNGLPFGDKTLPPSSLSSSSPSSSSASSPDDNKHVTLDSCTQVNGWRRSSKGNLKNSQHPQPNGTPESRGMTRRVSFDPLALLLDAALEGELELVKKTARQVPDPSAAKDEGLTALHNAICAGHFPVVKFLVEFGCDVNAQDSEGWTPLHCAASCNNVRMVEFLVEHGACVFATTFSDHETPSQKCDEDEPGFETCSQYLHSIQEKMGVVNGGVVYSVYDYDAQNSDELSFKDGDRVTIVRKGDDQEIDWWWARMGSTPREGYVPRTLFALFPRVKPFSRSTGDPTSQ